MRLARIAPLFMLAASAAVGAAQATPPREEIAQTEQLKSLSLAQLGNVKVTTVTKEPEGVWQTPAAIYVLTQDDIRRSGATTLPDLLRTVPGVEVAEIEGNQWAVGIRGFGSQFSRGVLLLIDGRSTYTDLFEGVYWDVQDVPLDNIQRIEIIRGPGGTIWGANAVNGVINIITKSARDTQGTLATALSGHVDRFNGLVREGLRYGALNLQFYVHGFLREPEMNPGFDPYDRWHLIHGGFRADWNPRRDDRVSAEGEIYGGQSGQQIGLGVYSPLKQISVDGPQDVSGGSFTFRWDHEFHHDSDLRLEAYFDRTNRQGPQFGETRNTFDVDFIDHFLWLKRQDIIWGAGVRQSPSNFVQTQATVDFLPHKQDDYIYSTFMQDTAHLIPDRLNLTVGTKLEYNNFSGFEYQPTARLLWNPTVHSTLWGAVSRAVRTPGRLDQDLELTGVASSNPPFVVRIEGDPTFKSEVLLGYEAGYRQLLTHSLYADVAAFYNRYDQLESYGNIHFSTITSPVTALLLNVPYANGIDGITNGVEIAPDWKPTPWWELKGSFSHLHIMTQPRPGYGDTGTAASYNGTSPHREATAQSYLDLPHGIDFDLDYRFVSALPLQSVKSYQTGDARIGWKIGRQLEISVAGRNLLQPAHGEFTGDNGNAVGIRRSVYAGLTWTH